MVTWQDEEAVKRLTATAGTKSKLAKPIQDLIKMIFDVESMKKAMVEFEVGLSSLHASLSSNLLHPASYHTLETWELRMSPPKCQISIVLECLFVYKEPH